MSAVRIATRGSDLALVQARWVAARIEALLGRETELVVIKTSGDRLASRPLAEVGGKGLFVKEIEEALLEDAADVAVHSAKDLPAALAPGLCLAAFPERADARDALVTRAPDASLATLARGARIGTGSIRRTAQLLAARSDVEVVPLRGNVPTRLRKLESEGLDALVLACAGLDRLGLGDRIRERLACETMLPAPCQGVLALEVREDAPVRDEIARLEHAESAAAARAERAFLARLGGDCDLPAGALAEPTPDGALRMRGLVASPDGRAIARAEEIAASDDAPALGARVAQAVLASGGAGILAAAGSA